MLRRSFDEVAALLRQHEVGRRAHIETPFGRRLLCYADLTATGRYLHFVEAWIRRVRPFYANTHTAVSSTGRILTELREEARRVIHRAVNAGDDDRVLFCGAGATAAVNKLVGLLGLRIPEPLERKYGLGQHIPQSERPVVFIGPYEHHSNELPWVETICVVEEIRLRDDGSIDLDHLEARLRVHRERPLKIGTFSAASNVTGLLSDVPEIARTLHRHGGLAFFDYAAAGPYVPMDMHPEDPEARIDALFLSTHKFVGGPQASGLLVAHRDLFETRIPERPGGGTVDYVTAVGREHVDYVSRLDEREEGGTPAIMSDIRAGVSFLVKELVDPEKILEHELALARKALARMSKNPRLQVLGSTSLPRLAILSFNVDGIHHDLVSALLDHLFGIQNRAGCSCAGPYGHRLLDIPPELSDRYRRLTQRGIGATKPGWVRVTLPYYASKADVGFLLDAIDFVAEHAEVFVPLYRVGWADGVWRHVERPQPSAPPLELTVEALDEAAQSFAAGDHEAPMSEQQLATERARYLAEARALAGELRTRWAENPPVENPPTGDPEVDELVRFRYVHAEPLPDSGSECR